MTGFVYKWTNTINDRWYIGSHKGTTDDGYCHSSKSLSMAEKKYGQENFIREILFEGEYDTDNIKTIEAKYLHENNAATNPLSYNQTNMTGLNCFDDATRLKMSESHKGNEPWNKGLVGVQSHNQEIRDKISKTTTGRTKSDKTKEKMRRSRLGWKYGPPTDAVRQVLREALLGKPKTKVTCPTCGAVGGLPAMKRWHFENCRES